MISLFLEFFCSQMQYFVNEGDVTKKQYYEMGGIVHIIICNPVGREKKKVNCTRIKFIADEQSGAGSCQWVT